jgi:hypothetical protein
MLTKIIASLIPVALVAGATTAATDVDVYKALTDKVYYYGDPGQSEKTMLWSDSSKMAIALTELHNLLTKTSLHAVNERGATSESVTKALDELQGRFALHAYNGSNIPFADLRELRGFHILTVAFSIMSGGYGIPNNVSFVQFYSNAEGTWSLVAEQPKDFNGCAFSAKPIPGLPDEALYLVWGMTIGDTGTRNKIRAYSFDGQEVRTTYKRDGLVRGIISVNGTGISVEYEEKKRVDDWISVPRRVRETLESGPGGIREIAREYLQ